MMELIKNNKSIQFIFDNFKKNNYECYLVGGAVRDILLNKEPDDYDFTTNATPDEIKEIFHDFPNLNYGSHHGTVTIIIDNIPYEITTYRIDGKYLDYRHPTNVSYTKSLKDDLSRRDLTINAFAITKDDNNNFKIVDYFNGLDDLKNHVIKCIGNPSDRFNEDALRILRTLRFACQLGYTIEEETSNAIISCSKLLNYISIERIISEIKKMIIHSCSDIINKYSSVFMKRIYILNDKSLKKTAKIIDSVDPIFECRFATFFVPIKNIENLSTFIIRLRISNESNELICALYNEKKMKIPKTSYQMRKVLGKYQDKTEIILRFTCQIQKKDLNDI